MRFFHFLAFEQEPVVFFSCFVGAVGMAAVVVVPPIRRSVFGAPGECLF